MKAQKKLVVAYLLASAIVPSALAGAQSVLNGAVTVRRTAAPEKRLDFEVTVPAPLDQVWTALSTSDGLKTWLWQDCQVDLRPGGDWLVNYPGGSTGGGTITAFEAPNRMEIAAMAPERFPTVRRERTRAVFTLKSSPDGKSTLVHLEQTGWKHGDEWDQAYAYLADGNAELLNNLRQRFISGPFDWKTILKQTESQSSAPASKNP